MIVSHKHRFIFVRTRKVAGTSVEVFLSRHCGEEDILTPMSPDEEAMRAGHGARNYRVRGCGGGRLLRMVGELVGRPSIGHGGFYNHMPAYEIRRLVGERIWNSYFKFSIERNPWDRQVSLYHWTYRGRKRKPTFTAFICSPFRRRRSPNFDIYSIDGKIAVDQVCRFERLTEDLAGIARMLGLPDTVTLGNAKGGFRPKRSWQQYYTPKTRDIVGEWYRREIEAFGYTFDGDERRPAARVPLSADAASC